MGLYHLGVFSVPHLPWHKKSVYRSYLGVRDITLLSCQIITSCFNDFSYMCISLDLYRTHLGNNYFLVYLLFSIHFAKVTSVCQRDCPHCFSLDAPNPLYFRSNAKKLLQIRHNIMLNCYP